MPPSLSFAIAADSVATARALPLLEQKLLLLLPPDEIGDFSSLYVGLQLCAISQAVSTFESCCLHFVTHSRRVASRSSSSSSIGFVRRLMRCQSDSSSRFSVSSWLAMCFRRALSLDWSKHAVLSLPAPVMR